MAYFAMRPKLSIIIPVYNVEKYLRKCVISLVHQDFENYEVILVDDGSTDGSSKICDELCETISDERLAIRVIHQPNAGVGAARNAGLKVAKGEYVCFVDSDDYWEPNVLGALMAQIERDNLDVLRFKYQNVNKQYVVFNPNQSNPYSSDDYSESVTDGITFLNTRMGTACYVVTFIIHRSLLDDCTFTPGIYFEDSDWLPRMLVRAKRVASADSIIYNYLIRQGSITKAIERSKQHKVLDDKMRLIRSMQQQAIDVAKNGKDNAWFYRIIAGVVISVIGILSVGFYDERKRYLAQLKQMNVYPLKNSSLKARIINFSPQFAVELLHWKNGNK